MISFDNNILEPPTFVKPMENREVTSGKSAILECMAAGSPKPSLLWLKDGKPIESTERHFFAAEDQLLIIVETIMSDSGIYKCEIRNSLGKQSGTVTLKVTPALISNVINIDEMTGIVIITVVCCAVGTSIVWVVIIYQSKRGNGCTNYTSPTDASSSGTLLTVYGVNDKKLSLSIKTTENEALLHNSSNFIIQTTQKKHFDNNDEIFTKSLSAKIGDVDDDYGDVENGNHQQNDVIDSPGRNSSIALNIDSDDRTSLTISISASPIVMTTTTTINSTTTTIADSKNILTNTCSNNDITKLDKRIKNLLPVNIVNNKLNSFLLNNEIDEISS